MKTYDLQKAAELRSRLEDLIRRCPVEQCHPEDCLLFPLVRMQQSDRVRWMNGLSVESLGFLTSYHYVCLGNKMER